MPRPTSIIVFRLLLASLLFLCPLWASAQEAELNEARSYLEAKDYIKAAGAYKNLLSRYPDQGNIYQDYLQVLLAQKDYRKAEELSRQQFTRTNNPVYLVDLGNVYKADNKEKKAIEQFEKALKYLNGDDVLTQQLANAFMSSGNDAFAIKTYEQAINITQSPFLYATSLARLYERNGQTEQAIMTAITASANMPQMRGENELESNLLELIGHDPEKARIAQKTIIRLVNASPEQVQYTYLLIWIFSVQNKWDQALVQVQALEKRSQDKGRLLQDLAMNALQKEQYDIAAQALQSIIDYGAANPRYIWARENVLVMRLQQIRNSPAPAAAGIAALQQDYARFFSDYPEAFTRPVLNDYALLEAQYADQVDHAISLLNQALAQTQLSKSFQANCKLQLGDYYIIDGQIWEAALVYSQVDKAFRDDALGEEARYRNAKLSYYRGDFDMAQGQLSVLKAATSELIANDALYLSILITENTPADSNMVPLNRFAAADLLLFRNKDTAASLLLDSLSRAFPEHPLNDDILLLQARIAEKHKDFTTATDLLKKIVERYGKDVLADDALWRLGYIYRVYLKNETEARKYYEQLILDYPGSTYVQQARGWLKAPAGNNPQP